MWCLPSSKLTPSLNTSGNCAIRASLVIGGTAQSTTYTDPHVSGLFSSSLSLYSISFMLPLPQVSAISMHCLPVCSARRYLCTRSPSCCLYLKYRPYRCIVYQFVQLVVISVLDQLHAAFTSSIGHIDALSTSLFSSSLSLYSISFMLPLPQVSAISMHCLPVCSARRYLCTRSASCCLYLKYRPYRCIVYQFVQLVVISVLDQLHAAFTSSIGHIDALSTSLFSSSLSLYSISFMLPLPQVSAISMHCLPVCSARRYLCTRSASCCLYLKYRPYRCIVYQFVQLVVISVLDQLHAAFTSSIGHIDALSTSLFSSSLSLYSISFMLPLPQVSAISMHCLPVCSARRYLCTRSASCCLYLKYRPYQCIVYQFAIEKAVVVAAPQSNTDQADNCCDNDYVDIYIDLKAVTTDLLDQTLHGRYCGNDLGTLPHLLISLHNELIVGFYTDDKRNAKGFLAEYKFIDASVYTPGVAAGVHVCGQTIHSDLLPHGFLLSPTYPGMYPDNLFCFYKLKGTPGQRIRVTFHDIDMYSGGSHCPFDYIKVYDGYTNQAEVIGVYCGRLTDITIYSTGEALHLEFVTKSGRVMPTKKPYVPYWEKELEYDTQRQGFRAEFEMSDKFVNLDFITSGRHVVGTECDQRILSVGKSNGSITSPGYPGLYPLNVTCFYYIDGLVNRENLEKTRLDFEVFDVPSTNALCEKGVVSMYLQGKDHTEVQPDHMYCGNTLPEDMVSYKPRLLLIFSSVGAQHAGRGFKAHFKFVTDYAIPGTPATEERCQFNYYSSSQNMGLFNSPRYPSYYPSSTDCVYKFTGLHQEQVRLTFLNFQVEDRAGNCTTDHLRVYSIRTLAHFGSSEELVGVLCGNAVPGPVLSRHDASILKVIFHSDNTTASNGFRAQYEFIKKKSINKRCFMNLTTGGGGLIHTPNYPVRYPINLSCEWHIYAKQPFARILLQFPTFLVEGGENGCPHAVVKLYPDGLSLPTHQFCGSAPVLHHFISHGRYMKVEFFSSSRAVGAKGFQISWTEITSIPERLCKGFHCRKSGYCIDSLLKCNKLPNCGHGDKSDEDQTYTPYNDNGFLHIILGVVASLILLIFIIFCVLHHRRKVHQRKHRKEIEVRYVTRAAGGTNPQPGSKLLLREETEKVSVVCVHPTNTAEFKTEVAAYLTTVKVLTAFTPQTLQSSRQVAAYLTTVKVLTAFTPQTLQSSRQVHQRKHRKEIEVRYVTRAAGGMNPQPGSKLLLREETEKVSVVCVHPTNSAEFKTEMAAYLTTVSLDSVHPTNSAEFKTEVAAYLTTVKA
ncbi:hypothetical protein LSAT2_007101 [Lamellibrachia satsuma]|nr:hypothetical protein LSAT2_007101 [Lamellibrachia satsuma]